MNTLLALALVIVIGVVFAVAAGRRRKLGPGNAWAPAIEGATQALAGRPAIAGDEAQLRAEIEGVTVTVKAQGDAATAEAALYPGAREIRLIVGSGLKAASEDVSHIPEMAAPPAFTLDPPVLLRSDDAARAVRIVEDSAADLNGLRRTARGESVELFVRGGSVRLTVRGARAAAETIEALARTTARVVARVGGDRALADARIESMPKPPAPAVHSCTFCGGERRPGVEWVRCDACASSYHAECWRTAGHCTKGECGSRAATAM